MISQNVFMPSPKRMVTAGFRRLGSVDFSARSEASLIVRTCSSSNPNQGGEKSSIQSPQRIANGLKRNSHFEMMISLSSVSLVVPAARPPRHTVCACIRLLPCRWQTPLRRATIAHENKIELSKSVCSSKNRNYYDGIIHSLASGQSEFHADIHTRTHISTRSRSASFNRLRLVSGPHGVRAIMCKADSFTIFRMANDSCGMSTLTF